jgi:transposase
MQGNEGCAGLAGAEARDCITYVGLDVHKEGIVVAVAEGGGRGEVREYGRIANTAGALTRLLRKLGGAGVRLRFCYEAGPCGYGIQRQLSALGHECVVVAPSLISKRAGDRIKTDRRDAANPARPHRAGELSAVRVPDAAHEAMRDLVRARLVAVHALRRARRQLSGFLLRQGDPGRVAVGPGRLDQRSAGRAVAGLGEAAAPDVY